MKEINLRITEEENTVQAEDIIMQKEEITVPVEDISDDKVGRRVHLDTTAKKVDIVVQEKKEMTLKLVPSIHIGKIPTLLQVNPTNKVPKQNTE